MKGPPEFLDNDTQCREQTDVGSRNVRPFRTGLALSGGGFRAWIFYLGVIRRLEELGILKHMHTVFAVSGGATIAAYRLIEMEKPLSARQEGLAKCPDQLEMVRLETFEEILTCCFRHVDPTFRSRSPVFSPFYHTLLFIQWFHHDETLGDLPNVSLSHVCRDLAGPTVVFGGVCFRVSFGCKGGGHRDRWLSGAAQGTEAYGRARGPLRPSERRRNRKYRSISGLSDSPCENPPSCFRGDGAWQGRGSARGFAKGPNRLDRAGPHGCSVPSCALRLVQVWFHGVT